MSVLRVVDDSLIEPVVPLAPLVLVSVLVEPMVPLAPLLLVPGVVEPIVPLDPLVLVSVLLEPMVPLAPLVLVSGVVEPMVPLDPLVLVSGVVEPIVPLAPLVLVSGVVEPPAPIVPVLLEPAAASELGVPVVPWGVSWVLCWPAPSAGLATFGFGGVPWATASPMLAAVTPASRPFRRVDAFIWRLLVSVCRVGLAGIASQLRQD